MLIRFVIFVCLEDSCTLIFSTGSRLAPWRNHQRINRHQLLLVAHVANFHQHYGLAPVGDQSDTLTTSNTLMFNLLHQARDSQYWLFQ